MVADGSISDVAVVYGRYGRYGKAGAEKPTGDGMSFYSPVLNDLLKKYRSSDPKLKKQGLFGLLELLKVKIPSQVRQAIYSEIKDKLPEVRASLLGGPATAESKFSKGDITNPFWVG